MACSKAENQVVGSATELLIKSMISVILCIGSGVGAQAQNTQPNSSDESWTATTEASLDNTNPSRTTESHTKSGNRSMDKQNVEVLGPDGRYQPSYDTEKETIQVDATTTRTAVRTYRPDGNGRRTLVQVTEEEARSSASGDTHVVRTTSNTAVDGKLQVVQREVADTTKTSPDAQETKITLYLADSYGGFTASRQTHELQTRGADHNIEVKTTTLVPDGNGKWEVGEVKEQTVTGNDQKRTTEEKVSRPDPEGKLSDVSRTIAEETGTSAGGRSNTVDTYSTVLPGIAGDGRLHLNQRVTTVQKKDTDRETAEQQVEQPDPVYPNAGLQVTTKGNYIVKYGSSGTEQTNTMQARDGSGTFHVFFVETRKSDQAPPAQVPTAPSDKSQ
jgi:hypothetical protein